MIPMRDELKALKMKHGLDEEEEANLESFMHTEIVLNLQQKMIKLTG